MRGPWTELLLLLLHQISLGRSVYILSIHVNPGNITDRVGPWMYGSGIETYENQMYGGDCDLLVHR